MILVIDNYDSFSYNIYQMLGELNPNIAVVRNDAVQIPEIISMKPSHIVLSPGPGRPADAGICQDVVRVFGKKTPILGICLGHQAICEGYGGQVGYAKQLMHGKPSELQVVRESPVFAGLPPKFWAARYHSLAAEAQHLPQCLQVTAVTADGEIMAVQHQSEPVFGLQFHPESILTPVGKEIFVNFLNMKVAAYDS